MYPRSAPHSVDPAVLTWVEEFAIFYERDGLPRMAGRILGWLLVCVPPHQSLDDLAAALQGSKASMSTMTRLLVQAGFVDRLRPPGSRSDQFVVPAGHWDNFWHERVRMVDAALKLLQRGLGLLAGRPVAQRRRLEELHNEYLWMSKEWPRLFARWQRERRRQARQPKAPRHRRGEPQRPGDRLDPANDASAESHRMPRQRG